MPDRPEFGGREIWLKREDLQRTRSFKERGALNALLCLAPEARTRGVVAASAGNHAAGLAFHGQRLGVKVMVVMPTGAPEVKVIRCRGLNAEVISYGDSFEAAQAYAEELAAATGRALVHPFADAAVMAGQGTIGLEIAEAVENFDTVVVPVGGGGLIAGVATALRAVRPGVKIVAVQAQDAGGASRLADGLAVAFGSRSSFAGVQGLIDRQVEVSDPQLASAIRLLARNGIMAEGAGAAALAAVLSGKIDGRRIVVPITGGNIDAKAHERIMHEPVAPAQRLERAA